MKDVTRTLNKMDVLDRVQNVADRIQTICLILDNAQHLEDVSADVEIYSEHPDIRGDLIELCVSELLSAAYKLNCIGEDCRQYEVEKIEDNAHETE